MFGYTLGAYYLIKGSLAASDYIKNQIGSEIFYLNKISHARFFVEQYLPASRALNDSIIEGKDALSLFDFDFLESSL